MDRIKIAVIGRDETSFIMHSTIETLKAAGYDAVFSKPEVSAIKKNDDAMFFVIYSDADPRSYYDAYTLLKDICIEKERRVFAIGYKEENDALRKILTGDVLAETFTRPVDYSELTEKIKNNVEKVQNDDMKRHILVVDDSGVMLRTIKSWLEPTYKVSIVSSGAMAISFLANNKPDLILLDYEMPICTGPQFMEMIRAEASTSSIPVIFLTSKGDRESVKSVLSLKPAGYLLKTMKPEEIVKSIDEFFERAKLKKLE